MGDPTGEADKGALKLDFDHRLMLQFRGSMITSDAGLLAYRELDDTLGLTDSGVDTLADARTGKNGRHLLVGLLRQSVFGRLAGYEDVNDAYRLCRDPAMRWVVGDRAPIGRAASASQMGRFETEWLVRPENLAALADLPGQWIDAVHQRRPPKISATRVCLKSADLSTSRACWRPLGQTAGAVSPVRTAGGDGPLRYAGASRPPAVHPVTFVNGRDSDICIWWTHDHNAFCARLFTWFARSRNC